jgi:hypothetical protein
MKSLKDLYPPDNIIRCDCGSHAFFDWGIEIIATSNFGKAPRNQDWNHTDNVKICASCLKPVVVDNGDVYDASDYVTEKQVKEILKRGQVREQTVSVKAMDP